MRRSARLQEAEARKGWRAPSQDVADRLVAVTIQTQKCWRRTLAALRLVSRDWCAAVSAALPALAPAPAEDAAHLLRIPAAFPHLKALRLGASEAGGGGGDAALAALAAALSNTLQSLRLLGYWVVDADSDTDRGAGFSPAGLTSTLGSLPNLLSFQLEASWEACAAALTSLTACRQLTNASIDPVPEPSEWQLQLPGLLRPLPAQAPSLLALAAGLPAGLRSLKCSSHWATAADVAALSRLTALSCLELRGLPTAGLPPLAALLAAAPGIRSLALWHLWNTEELLGSCERLPASAFANITALTAPWELLVSVLLPSRRAPALPAGALQQLTFLSLFMTHFEEEDQESEEEEEGAAGALPPPAHQLFASWLTSAPTQLRRLHMYGGRQQWPPGMLCALSRLQALSRLSLTFTDLDEPILASIQQLPQLRDLSLDPAAHPRPDLGLLPALRGRITRLALSTDGLGSAAAVAAAVAQLTALRRLELYGELELGPAALEPILRSLPHLELLETAWEPEPGDASHARFMAAWGAVVLPGVDIYQCRGAHLAFDAAAELKRLAER